MATYYGGVGSPGENLSDGNHSIGVSLAANEYPISVSFATGSGGAYWTNSYSGVTKSAVIYLCGGSDGYPYVALDTITLGGGKSRTDSLTYNIDGSGLMGCTLYLWISNGGGGVSLRNACTITIVTATMEVQSTPTNGVAREPVYNPDIYRKLLPTIDQNDSIVGLARRSTWDIKVQGVDITDEIAKDLISMEITDNEENEADDLQIKLADRQAVWLHNYLSSTVRKGAVNKGLTFTVWIGTQTHTGKISQQKSGTFLLDSMKHSGPPSVTTIKCSSLDFAGGIRTQKNDKSWENYDIRGIAQEIAQKGGLSLLYCSEKNPKSGRREQSGETDISFLVRICQDAGLSVKITDYQLVIFNREQFENDDALYTIYYGDGSYTKWDFSTTSGETTYDICTVRYTDPSTGQCITGEYKSLEWYEEEEEDEPKHQELVITNKKVTDWSDAASLAEAELNLKNLFERTVTLTFPGNPAIMAGLPMILKRCGYWTGKYMINQVKHTISTSGYTTKVKLRFVESVPEDGEAVAMTEEQTVAETNARTIQQSAAAAYAADIAARNEAMKQRMQEARSATSELSSRSVLAGRTTDTTAERTVDELVLNEENQTNLMAQTEETISESRSNQGRKANEL